MKSVKPRLAYAHGFIVMVAVGLVGSGLIAAQPTLGQPTPAPAPRPSAQEVAGADFVPGHVIVKFREGTSQATADSQTAALGLQTLGHVGNTGAQLVQIPPGHEEAEVKDLKQRSDVEYAELNYVLHGTGLDLAPADQSARIPVDQYYPRQWDMAKINMPAAWAYTVGSPNVLVAVLDSGIDLTHPDLASQWTYAPGVAPAQHVFLTSPDPSCPPSTSPNDDGWIGFISHGTHLAGVIAAASFLAGGTPVGIAGEAPGARILPVKILDCTVHGSSADLIGGIEFAATHGARIINLSVAGYTPDDTCPASLQQAINDAWNAGALLIAGAGNDGTDPILNSRPSFPAACNHVLGVGATDTSDNIPSFSERNGTVKLLAPGVDILSSLRFDASSDGWQVESGTSMAVAHVSGCAALLYSLNPFPTPAQVTTNLVQSAVPLPTGTAPPGVGRLDCGAAVAIASGHRPSAPTSTLAPQTGPAGSSTLPTSPSPPAPVVASAIIGSNGGTSVFTLPGGQTGRVSISADHMAAVQASDPVATQAMVAFNPAPVPPNAAAAGSLGGGVVVPVSGPIDLRVDLTDASGGPVPIADDDPAGQVTADVTLPITAIASTVDPNGVFVWLQEVDNPSDGSFFGYVRPPTDFDPSTNSVTFHPSLASLQNTLLLPVVLVPAWVANFDDSVHIYSGPDPTAIDFGDAGPAFTVFSVVAPQVGSRLYVFDVASGNYGWVDVSGVGPAGPPPGT